LQIVHSGRIDVSLRKIDWCCPVLFAFLAKAIALADESAAVSGQPPDTGLFWMIPQALQHLDLERSQKRGKRRSSVLARGAFHRML
jgi:hypothetical protein